MGAASEVETPWPAGSVARRLTTPAVHVVAWVVVGVVLNATWVWLYNELWTSGMILLALHCVWGLALLLWLAFGAKQQSLWSAFAMVLLLPTFFVLGSELGLRTTLLLYRPAIDDIVRDVAAGVLRPASDSRLFGIRDGVEFAFDVSQPDLIAFSVVKGIPDGGVAIVYDPSGAAERITSEDWSMAPNLDALLVGRPESCQRFAEPHFYICDYS